MNKKMNFAMALLALSLSLTVQAEPGPTEMEANYKRCVAEKDGWFRKWGQYVISFDRSEASDICRDGWYHSVRTASCKLDGKRLYAGFYCEDSNNH